MPMLVKLARVSTRRAEVWRHCEVCDELAAMPPFAFVCDTCSDVTPSPYRLRRRWS